MGWLEGGTAVLAFRGTQTAQDGLQDVKIVRQSIDHLQKMFPGTQAHSGKLSNYMHVFEMSALHLRVCMFASLNVCIHLSIPPCVCLFVQCLLFTLCLCLCSSLCSCTNPRSLQHGRLTACVCAPCLICIACAAGFLQQFAGVCQPDVPEKNMSSVIEQLSGGRIPTRVLCCGHSLGGALATLGMTYIAAVYDVSVLVCHSSLACLLLRDRPLPVSRGFARACHVCCAARVSAMC